MKKQDLSEEDVRDLYITPNIVKAGWNQHDQIRREVYFTDGKIIVEGNKTRREKGKKADYILYSHLNYPIAVIEAKKNIFTARSGIQQAIEYAQILDIPFAYSSNGETFIEHDRTTGKEHSYKLDKFPGPSELWNRYKKAKKITLEEEQIIEEPYYYIIGGKKPRYYQTIAINKTIEAIAKGNKRILIVMATGTGKTYTAFQIMYRLWKGKKKRKILYLSDRNIIVDQSMAQEFQPFKDVITKIQNKKMDSSYEIYTGLYQQLADREEIFKYFTKDFFDLIIVDECHRGSAKEDSKWREVLEYYHNATQIGLTATPKETKEISNIEYFGEPIYTYSLKQGIEDGFLAPYKVIRIEMDKDKYGYLPELGKKDINGNLLENKRYGQRDFDKTLIIQDRTKRVAQKVTQILKQVGRYSKTIVFCVDIEHAERMREALINENSDVIKNHPNYIVKITSGDKVGKAQLDNFLDVEERYPSIVTTSKLMTTGVNSKTCKIVVIDTNIKSMIEFKQIIGRAARVDEEYEKSYFIIIDFRNVSRLFEDKQFDGEPISIINIKEKEEIPEELMKFKKDKYQKKIRKPGDMVEVKTKLEIDDVEVSLIKETVHFYYSSQINTMDNLSVILKKKVKAKYKNYTSFVTAWNAVESKEKWLKNLLGITLVDKMIRTDRDYHIFDQIGNLVYHQKELTKKQRIYKILQDPLFKTYSQDQKVIINLLLERFQEELLIDLSNIMILKLPCFEMYGNPIQITQHFGEKKQYQKIIKQIENKLYGE